MSRATWLTAHADPKRAIPASAEERSWAIEAAIGSLDQEERRLTQLGFERQVACCREQKRFWEFVRALHTLEPTGSEARPMPASPRKLT